MQQRAQDRMQVGKLVFGFVAGVKAKQPRLGRIPCCAELLRQGLGSRH
jgi:hypothetical protein